VTRPDDIRRALRHLAPRIPNREADGVLDHALHSRGLKGASPEAAAWLSLVAYVRHSHTEYDELRDNGYDRDAARFFVLDEINRILKTWGAKRTVSAEE
jgi:hypothetical protein